MIRISPIACAFGDSEEPQVNFIVDVVSCFGSDRDCFMNILIRLLL